MLSGSQNLMVNALSNFTTSPGQRKDFGKFRYLCQISCVNRTEFSLQSSLPDGAKPLTYILYADKTNLSPFGTKKAYPIVARIANLPVEFRNGEQMGGGRIVGWLPIVSAVPPLILPLCAEFELNLR